MGWWTSPSVAPSILSSPRAVVKDHAPHLSPILTTKPQKLTLAPGGTLMGHLLGLHLENSVFVAELIHTPSKEMVKLAAGPEKQGSGLGGACQEPPEAPRPGSWTSRDWPHGASGSTCGTARSWKFGFASPGCL